MAPSWINITTNKCYTVYCDYIILSYCKTRTTVWYKVQNYHLHENSDCKANPALPKYLKNGQQNASGTLVTRMISQMCSRTVRREFLISLGHLSRYWPDGLLETTTTNNLTSALKTIVSHQTDVAFQTNFVETIQNSDRINVNSMSGSTHEQSLKKLCSYALFLKEMLIFI